LGSLGVADATGLKTDCFDRFFLPFSVCVLIRLGGNDPSAAVSYWNDSNNVQQNKSPGPKSQYNRIQRQTDKE